jgi:hypothetical protein
MTQFFYVNLQFNDSFHTTSYLFGCAIALTMNNLANLFNITNVGDEVYPLRGWPVIAQENVDAYQERFDQEWVSNKSLYVTRLSTLHRLLFVIINNILTLKST